MLNGSQDKMSSITPEEVQKLEHQAERQQRIQKNLLQENQNLRGQLFLLQLMQADASESPPKTNYEMMKERRDKRRLKKG